MSIAEARRAPVPALVMTRRSDERALLERAVAAAARPPGPLQVLEAGCGQRWPLTPEGVELRITGVDADPEALRLRREVCGDLAVALVGDLRTIDLPLAAFDLAYCSYVLEHVEGAEAVLDRLVAATRPGGRLVIRVPDGDTVYGFVVRHSPHRTHVLYKRYVEGFPDAGKPGHAPYPTVYEPVVSLRGLREYARVHDLDVVEEYGMDAYLDRLGPLRGAARAAVRAVARLSGGRVTATHNDIGMVLRRPAPVS